MKWLQSFFRSRSILLFALLWASASVAQDRGFRAHRYEGSAAGSWLFMLERPWYSLTRYAAVGVAVDASHNVLVPTVATGRGEVAPIVSTALVGHVELAGSLFDRVRLSASLPVTFLEQGTPEVLSGAAPLQTVGIGDPRVGLMVRLGGQAERDPFSAHLGADVWIPIGAQASHQGDSTVRLLPRAVFAGALGVGRWTVDLGFLQRAYSSIGPPGLGLVAAPEARAGVAFGVSLLDDHLYLGPEAQFSMQVIGDGAFTPAGMSLELLGGVHYLIADTVLVGVAGGTGLFKMAGTPDARGIFRLAWAPRRSGDSENAKLEPTAIDADLDGVLDEPDRCPFEPETKNGIRDEDGCPEAEAPTDVSLAKLLRSETPRKAGEAPSTEKPATEKPATEKPATEKAATEKVATEKAATEKAATEKAATEKAATEKAATEKAATETAATEKAATEKTATEKTDAPTSDKPSEDARYALAAAAFATNDSDGDGVPDEADRCPVVAEDADGFEDEDGCPELDNDQDGLVDAKDTCPSEAETLNALKDDDGCPDVAEDADQDGVADAVDRCPFEPETINGLRDLDGCPEIVTPEQVALAKILAPPEAPLLTAPTATATATAKPDAPRPEFGMGDADNDKVLDVDDRCPVTPEDADGFEDEDGCPELDNDDDLVADAKDKCPESAESVNGWQDDDGCPDEHPDVDSDGVEFVLDRCPLEPGDATDGCPHEPRPALALPGFALPLVVAAVTPTAPIPTARPLDPATADFDKDGTPDEADACPMTKEDADGFEDEDGCPEADNDSDGVEDKADKCAFEAESINGVKDEDGCPDVGESVVHVTKTAVVIDRVVQFKPASATLETASTPLLKQVAATLKASKSISVEIQGHTDDTGSATANIKLSQKRADTIKAFLVKAGVSANRLVAKGYGPTRPRATNKTPDGREKNRRVEFQILGEAK